MGLSSFYRPLLNLPAALLNSTAFILLFLLCHLYHSPDSRIFSYWLCQHLLTFLAFLPPPAPILSHLTIQAWKRLSLSSHSPYPHPILTFILIWCHPLVQLAALHSLKVPQRFPACCIPWPSSSSLPQTICTCSLLFSGRVPTSFAPGTHTFT